MCFTRGISFKQVLILQPFNYCKNMVQQRQPISLNPAHMYRGVGANAVNMGSCTMIQFAVGGKMKQFILGSGDKATPRHLTLAEEMACGVVGVLFRRSWAVPSNSS